ncbi:DUF2306 domain-containing protein [Arthrobacter sp. Z1-15]
MSDEWHTHHMIALHVLTVTAALVSGIMVLVLPKGSVAHKRLGWLYLASTVVMALSSFGIYELRSGPSLFHAVSVTMLITVGLGVYQPLRRKRSSTWLFWHLLLLQISYVMLVVTGIAQFFDRLPFSSPAANAVVFLQLPLITGIVFIALSARSHRMTRVPA